MFKWPGLPSPRAPAHEVADFAELVCWRDGGTSLNGCGCPCNRIADMID